MLWWYYESILHKNVINSNCNAVAWLAKLQMLHAEIKESHIASKNYCESFIRIMMQQPLQY